MFENQKRVNLDDMSDEEYLARVIESVDMISLVWAFTLRIAEAKVKTRISEGHKVREKDRELIRCVRYVIDNIVDLTILEDE